MKWPMYFGFAAIGAICLCSCATESSRAITPQQVNAASRPYSGPKVLIAIGKFENRSNYLRGIFSDGVDRLGDQGKTILISHLQSSGRFAVLERENLSETKQESTFSGSPQHISGANFIVTGGVTEFGRKETGDQQLFGIAGSGKSQNAYCKVAINVVDVVTSEVVATASGAGEYALSSREVLGFGGAAGYDSTLNGKVLDLAVREAVDRLVAELENSKWNERH